MRKKKGIYIFFGIFQWLEEMKKKKKKKNEKKFGAGTDLGYCRIVL